VREDWRIGRLEVWKVVLPSLPSFHPLPKSRKIIREMIQ
jgi:hypothetical protein